MITALDYALNVAHQDIDTTSASDELSKLRAELTALRARVAELEAQAGTLRPRNCAMECAEVREQAAKLVANYAIDMLSTDGDELDAVIERDYKMAAAIRAMPLPCNPLEPDS